MIALHNLTGIRDSKNKRVGRGYGSGKGGHTTTRGIKGRKARGKVSLTFDGTKIKKSWVKRLPFWRGKGRQKSIQSVNIINIDLLNKLFKKGETVSKKTLLKKGLIKKTDINIEIKVLGKGKLEHDLVVLLPCSEKAKAKILESGGSLSEKPKKARTVKKK